jgi:hypothetical protein
MKLRAALVWALLGVATAQEAAPDPILIEIVSSRGSIIPQSKGGGGFQRSFRFHAKPGKANHWIQQVLEVRGTVFDAEGRTKVAHLDVIEYYRVDAKGKAIQADSHYSQYWNHCGGDLTISSTLTYGKLERVKVGDTILSKSFVLRSCLDEKGEPVVMKKRTTKEIIAAEHGKRVRFEVDPGSIPTRYSYRVQWDARDVRTQPSGTIEVGTYEQVLPEQTGHTRAEVRPEAIPVLGRRS